MTNYLFTSESVAIGHPDKVADQISDAILDACLEQDENSRVACETLVTAGIVFLAGEITTKATFDYNRVVREMIRKIGYEDPSIGFDYISCGIMHSFNQQSPDIAQGVDAHGVFKQDLGAGDQGLMFGFACDETPELMPMPIMLSHYLVQALKNCRETGQIPYLKPDGKAQVTIEYTPDHKPLRVHTIVLSTQHAEGISHEKIVADMRNMIHETLPQHLLDDRTRYFINPTGRFVIGGPVGDCGLTGRKIIVDTYGGAGHHGGGAFSGKDATKVDRSGSYAARYAAKNIVASKLARKCEIQVSYSIGYPHPISIKVDTFGTGIVPDGEIAKIIPHVFDFTAGGIIEMLQLKRPIFRKTAFSGHFGRSEKEFTWEATDRTSQLLTALGLHGK